MIISTLRTMVRTMTGTASGAVAADWQCLVRRGMLHSECEAVEQWTLPAGARLQLNPAHGVEEALLVLDGELLVSRAEGTTTVGAGQLALVPHGIEGDLRAGDRPARVITVRTLAAVVTDRLPPRVPELITP
ncbi:cupin domain-containing protein [Streptomyces panaciradicis]|uniref:cupin domain-containing protein n=1 Tax=Streptomyces panaciradicis TaxID=1470261 RepID=UPI00201D1286|nr:cupin domain-containing protein [Streptomyces panaciradicis]MCL6670494.1 cupin domain-containing protein [Streptomyces panaciradicis]